MPKKVQTVHQVPAGATVNLRPHQGLPRGLRQQRRELRRKRDLRAGRQEPEELPRHGAPVLPAAHHFFQQLDAH